MNVYVCDPCKAAMRVQQLCMHVCVFSHVQVCVCMCTFVIPAKQQCAVSSCVCVCEYVCALTQYVNVCVRVYMHTNIHV
jgi:hypothetical protein